MIFAQGNDRIIPKEDKVFAINGRAKAAIAEKGKEKVSNATIGALLDDEGDLVILSSVMHAIERLKAGDYAEYAPIGGTPEFKEAVKKALFMDIPVSGEVRVVGTPGGTGAIRNVVSNYTEAGGVVLTHDWFWANYRGICTEMGRTLEVFEMFDEDNKFEVANLDVKLSEIAKEHDSTVLMINTPAHNPTGYSLTDDDWKNVVEVVNRHSQECRITLFVDVAYIDFAGDEREARSFIPLLEEFGENVLVVFGYSASKTLTLYGMRCGAMVCMTPSKEIADEFVHVTEFSARATWSNCNRAAQVLMGMIYDDPELQDKVSHERAEARKMLLERGRAFEETLHEEGIVSVPFSAGFFASVACDDPEAVAAELEKQDIYCVALAKGVRISVASISKDKCVKAAKAIAGILK